MLKQFRTLYPHGSIVSELVNIDRGQYIVKVSIKIDRVVLSTGLAAADKIETAEDNARERALLALALDTISNLSKSAGTVIDHSTQEINKLSNLAKVSLEQESRTEKKTDRVQPLAANASISSPSTPVAKIEPEVNNHLIESSAPPHEIDEVNTDLAATKQNTPDKTEFNTSVVTPSNQDLRVESIPEQLDNPLPEAPPPVTYEEKSSSVPTSQDITNSSTQMIETVEFDFNEIKSRTDVEIKRLGWTKEQGRDFLLQTYGKRSRLHLTDQELMDFLHYLESQSNPT
ncbi:MAG: hypothetical protein QNJ34_02950 [Xenococcaceae cyanobacterium MO_188.B29]|nr:hypothetical protein [Xenococcaceae cyanobacterium MO_188.B29]